MLRNIPGRVNLALPIFAALIALSCSARIDDSTSGTVRKMVQRAGLESAHCGVLVREVTTGDVCLALNAERLFVPASTLKLLTTYAALLQFGPDHRFKTRLWVPKEQTEAAAVKTIILQGGGDPFLADNEWDEVSPAAFNSLAAGLKRRGITAIREGILVDASLFGERTIPDDWSWGDLDRFHGAPVGSMNAGHNVIITEIRPGPVVGSDARVRIVPDLPSHIALHTEAITAPRRTRSVTARLRRLDNTIIVVGTIGVGWEKVRLAVAVRDPSEHAGRWFAKSLSENGIETEGDVQVAYEPVEFSDYLVAAVCSSESLYEIVGRTLRESDNLGAECLARHIELIPEPASGEAAADDESESSVLSTLHGRGMPVTPPAKITDGSGLSRTNLLSPIHLTWVLADAVKESRFNFPATLPHLDNNARLEDHSLAVKYGARLAAKTGSFQTTHCLAGYYLDEQGNPMYAFAVMVNGLEGGSEPALDFEALVIEEIEKIASRRDG